MKTEMLMPQMGESIAEATVLKWLKNVGDKVSKDETILEISTDKVDSEIPAPASGVLTEIKAAEGATVPVKSIIAIIDTEGGAAAHPAAAAPAEKAPAAPAPAAAKPPVSQPSAPAAQSAAAPVSSGASASEVPSHVGERFYSPLVRSLAAQHGLSPNELAHIAGSGAQGRVTKNDVLNYLDHRGSAPAASFNGQAGAAAVAPAASSAGFSIQAPAVNYDPNRVTIEPMDNMRKRIAEHMVMSKHVSPHVYSVAEIDVTNIARWREKHKDAFLKREGIKLSFTPFFLEAAVKALAQFPRVNASVDGTNVILRKDINLGCAVALGTEGLIVPVIKNADQLNLVGIARSLNDLASRARDKKLSPDDIQGGTFTVTNPGMFGNIIGCPIINQPQVAILAVCAIKKRPVVVDNAIAIRDIVYLTLSYDHRVIDGSLGGRFLHFITEYLEGWDMKRELF